jgi:uncharacterized glyoxalase superfamily protein PhnB
MKVAPYLHFKDKAQEATEIYQSIFEAKVINQYKYKEGMTENPALIGKIFHAELIIGDLNLYLCDTDQTASFESLKFLMEISDKDQAHFFSKLSTHGEIIQGFTKMHYGPTNGKVEDKFGVKWHIVIC